MAFVELALKDSFMVRGIPKRSVVLAKNCWVLN